MLAVVLAVLVGVLMIAFTDERLRATDEYVLLRPMDFFTAASDAIQGAYTSLFQGSIYNTRVEGSKRRIRPLTETLKSRRRSSPPGSGSISCSAPRFFNIGGRGQMLLAGAAAGWVGFNSICR